MTYRHYHDRTVFTFTTSAEAWANLVASCNLGVRAEQGGKDMCQLTVWH